jgi:hypothetical protein
MMSRIHACPSLGSAVGRGSVPDPRGPCITFWRAVQPNHANQNPMVKGISETHIGNHDAFKLHWVSSRFSRPSRFWFSSLPSFTRSPITPHPPMLEVYALHAASTSHYSLQTLPRHQTKGDRRALPLSRFRFHLRPETKSTPY